MNNTPTPIQKTNEQATAATTASDSDRLLEAGVHVLGIFTSFIGALIVYLVKKEEPQSQLFIQAKDALNFQITVAIAYVIAWVLTFVLIGLLLMPIVSIFNIVMCIVAAVKVYERKPFKYPFSLQLVK